jgi:hypothetical protein
LAKLKAGDFDRRLKVLKIGQDKEREGPADQAAQRYGGVL